MNDPEDDKEEPQLARQFTFRGKPLPAYSFNHRAAMYRLGSQLTDYEFCAYLLRILLLPEAEIDDVRSPESVKVFRIESGKWADREGLSDGDGLKELQSLVDAILAPVDAVEKIQPAADPKKKQANRRGSIQEKQAAT